MREKNKILVLLCWLFISGSVCMFADNKDAKQKLVQKLAATGHDTLRLKTLCELVDITKPEPKVRKQYVNELLEEAKFQNSNLYKCRAYLYHIFMNYNENNREELQKWLDLLVPLARQEKYYDMMFEGKQCAIDLLVLNEAFEELENEARNMLREAQAMNNKRGVVMAYQSIARACRVTDRTEEAAKMLEKAYDLSLEIDNYALSAEINNGLIAVYKLLQRKTELLKCIQQSEKLINDLLRKQPDMKPKLQIDFFILYISYAEYYLSINDLQKAKEYMQLTDKYYTAQYYINRLRYNELNKTYNIATKQWENALSYIDTLIVDYKKVEYSYYNKALLDKAEVLAKLGRCEQALPIYEKALTDNDSILVSVYNKQVDFLNNAQVTEKKQLQTLRFRHYISLSVLLLIAAILIVVFIFFIIKYRINRELYKSEKQMRRIAEEVEMVNKVKESFISNMNHAIREPLTEVVDCSLALASDKDFSLEEKKRASGVISKTATDLSQLINDILDLSRLEAGMMKFQVADISFNFYLQEALGIATANYMLQVNNKLNQDVDYSIHYDGSWLFRLMRSVFMPIENLDEALLVLVEESLDGSEIVITTYNSILITPNPAQSIVIQNEMNRMLVEHFGGSWGVTSKYVKFTIPLVTQI